MKNVRLCDICGKVIQRNDRRGEIVIYPDEIHQNVIGERDIVVCEGRYDICESCYFSKIRDMIKVDGEND